MSFGKQLLLARKKNKLSAEQLARKCHVSRSYITLIENGRRLPSKVVMPKIAAALKIKTDVVIDWYVEGLRIKLVNALLNNDDSTDVVEEVPEIK